MSVSASSVDFWPVCLGHFERMLSPQQFNTWFRPLRGLKEGRGTRELFAIEAPNSFVMKWVRDRFQGEISDLASAHFGYPISVQFRESAAAVTSGATVPVSEPESASAADRLDRVRAEPAGPATRPSSAGVTAGPLLNSAFTFNALIEGKANQFARAAALKVAYQPGGDYNPLFVYGGVGLGKTHLIQAIGHQLLVEQPGARVRYIHAERYVSDVVRAYQQKSFEAFKSAYASVDLLLVDDIQFFNGKSRTQEEFFYLFNSLVEARKQIVMTSDTYPKALEGLDERLKSRFGWGLTVSLDPPELEMRVAILNKKSELVGVVLPSEVAYFIAGQIRSNVRELEGALKRVAAYCDFYHSPITLATAKDALKDLIAVQNRQISIENIQKTVAEHYALKISDLLSQKRLRQIVRPRQVAMYLAKDLTAMSLPEIGAHFAGRDHTTVLHSCRQIAKQRETDAALSHDINLLVQILKS